MHFSLYMIHTLIISNFVIHRCVPTPCIPPLPQTPTPSTHTPVSGYSQVITPSLQVMRAIKRRCAWIYQHHFGRRLAHAHQEHIIIQRCSPKPHTWPAPVVSLLQFVRTCVFKLGVDSVELDRCRVGTSILQHRDLIVRGL